MTHPGASAQWEVMWQAGGKILQPKQAFDTGGPCRTLLALLKSRHDTIKPMKWRTALVPGGGRGYDAYAIAKSGLVTEVQQLDLSQTATNEATKWLKSQADYSELKVEAKCGDFFSQKQSQFDFIFDCTFMCALDASVREAWAAQHKSLLRGAESELWTLIFPIRPGVDEKSLLTQPGSGPPYSMSFELVEALLTKAGLQLVHLEKPHEDLMHMPNNPWGAKSLLACWKLK